MLLQPDVCPPAAPLPHVPVLWIPNLQQPVFPTQFPTGGVPSHVHLPYM